MHLFQKKKSVSNVAIDSDNKVSTDSHLSSFKQSRRTTTQSRIKRMKEMSFRFFARIDYNIVLKHLFKLRYLDPRLAIAILIIEKIKIIFENYNQSKSENKEIKLSEQLLRIGKEFKLIDVIEILVPFSRKIPYGRAIVIGLRLISTFTAKREKAVNAN